MLGKFALLDVMDSDEVNVTKSPIILAIAIVYIATVVMQNAIKISIVMSLIFTIIMLIHLLLYLFSNTIFKNKHWLYFVIQGIIINSCAVIMPNGYKAIFLGLIPVLICQSVIVYYRTTKVVITSTYFYAMFCGTTVVLDGAKELISAIPMLILITVSVRAYSAIFLKQVKLRIQTQKILKELEFAYEKVEELTLINERQRMARDLHDTLSQGLAGLIMQLDAVNANLNKNNTKRAQEIVLKSMDHARKTLADSRLVIDDLRFKTNADIDFTKAVENEISQFRAVSTTFIAADIRIESQIPIKILKHILYIVRESLNNIAKHAKAKNAVVKIIENDNKISINIVDDGIGFDVNLLNKLSGHYGILGITERTKAIHGEIKIESKRKSGTNISIIIPIEKGIYDENE